MTTGIKEHAFILDEGAVVLQWPERLSKTSAQDMKEWLALIGRKIERASESSENQSDQKVGEATDLLEQQEGYLARTGELLSAQEEQLKRQENRRAERM